MKKHKKSVIVDTVAVTDFSGTVDTSTFTTTADATWIIHTGGFLSLIGGYPTFNVDQLDLDATAANRYANSLSYRDGWQFYVEGSLLKANVASTDPIDRRIHITIWRSRPLMFPTTREMVDHLALDLIREIEDHERLEWLLRHRPYRVGERVFPPHTPMTANPFTSNDGFDHGKTVYREHDAFMESSSPA